MNFVKNVDGDVSRWVAITAAVAVVILPYAVGMLLGIYDIRLMQAFEIGNPLDSVIWIVAAAWLAASAVVSDRRLAFSSVVGVALVLFVGTMTYQAIQRNEPRVDRNTSIEAVTDASMLRKLEGHAGPVKTIAVSADGKLAASASGWPKGDGSVRLWDLDAERMLWVRHPGPKMMMAVAITRDGQRIIGGGRDGNVYIWDAETARELHRFQAANPLEGICLFDDDRQCVIAASSVQKWNLETLEMVQEFAGTQGTQLDVSLSGDRTRVATGGFDKSVHVWDLESGKENQAHHRSEQHR